MFNKTLNVHSAQGTTNKPLHATKLLLVYRWNRWRKGFILRKINGGFHIPCRTSFFRRNAFWVGGDGRNTWGLSTAAFVRVEPFFFWLSLRPPPFHNTLPAGQW